MINKNKHGDISDAHYAKIHHWLKNNFGTATRCENQFCEKKSNNFQYALINGKKYEPIRENFQMLCVSCHIKYDLTEEKRKKLSLSRRGKKTPNETKIKMCIAQKKRWETYTHSDETRKKISDGLRGKIQSKETREKQRKARASLTRAMGIEIIKEVNTGAFQWVVGKKYSVPQSMVSRVVNNKYIYPID